MNVSFPEWRQALPNLQSERITLREPQESDLGPLVDLLSISDSGRFDVEEPLDEMSVRAFIDRGRLERAAGTSITYVITLSGSGTVVGVTQVRALDASFATGEWELTLAPSVRGSGVFLESSRLIGSFLFQTVGVHRLEARAMLHHGRANGALLKLGAVQEGVLRQSMRYQGVYVDQVLWSVLREDWGSRWVPTALRVH